MRHRTALMISLVTGIALLGQTVAVAKERTPEGSFLKYRANTVQDLKKQVSGDSVARTRYAKHFSAPADVVAKSLEDGVKLVTLKKATRVQMWYVDKKGSLKQKAKLLPKGSYVFASSDGKPFLAWSCGNPLRASLPSRPAIASTNKAKPAGTMVASAKELDKNAGQGALGDRTKGEGPLDALTEPAPPPAPANTPLPTNIVETKVLPAPVEVMVTPAITAPPTLMAQVTPALALAEPALMAPALAAAAAPVTAALAPAALSAGGGAFLGGLGWLGGLAAIGGGFALLGGGGGDNPPGPPEPPTPDPVPEPGTLLALAMGLSSMGVVSIRRIARRS